MPNNAPVAQPVARTTEEDASILVSAVFTDADGSDTHTFTIDASGALGTVTNNNDGTFSYDPNGQFEHLAAGETTTDTFTYTVDDGNGGTSTETVTITLTGQNDAPVAVAVAAAGQENGTVITVTADYSDADTTDSHSFAVDTTGTLGTVTNNYDGTFSYDPNGQFEHLAAGETATDTFTYTVDDGNGGTSTETVTITLTGQNDAPVAVAVAAAGQENGAAITVTADYSDADTTDSHSFTVDTTGTLGTVTNNNDGTFSYDPNGQFEHLAAGETAIDTFSYTVDDGNGGTSTETVTITVTGQNDAPVALAIAGVVSEDGSAITFAANFSDADASDTHSVAIDTSGTSGSVTDNGDGTFSYDANGQYDFLALGETATDTFTYTVTDSSGESSTETVTVTITGQNDAPVAGAVAAVAQENGTVITVTADYSDADTTDSHSFTVDTTGTLGTVTNNNDGTFAYDPNGQFEHLAAGETATDTFTYTVNDGNGGSSTETVTITLTGQNDAPVAVAVAAAVLEDGPAITIAADYSDPDGSDTHTFIVDTTATLGTVTNNNDGTFSYDPNGQFEHLGAGETATDTFTYTVDDGNGGISTETVTVTITGQNDAPVVAALDAATQENGAVVTVTAAYSDVDSSGSFVLSLDTTGTLGSVTDNGDGTFSYDPNGQFEYLAAGETATDTFTYTVNDGDGGSSTETVTITLTGQNDGPVTVAVAATAQEDGPAITITADYSDPDASDTHTFSVDTTGTIGIVTNHNDGTFSYDPNGQFEYLAVGETATDTFTYTVTDPSGVNSTEIVTVTVTGQNDAPVVVALAAATTEDGPSVTLTADFSDIDTTDNHSFSTDTTGTLGAVTDHGDGTFTYDPNGQFEHLAAGETATDTFTYTVDDGNGGVSTETVTITITGQNDAPVALAVAATAPEDGPVLTIVADFSDADASDTHTFSVDTTGTIGTVTNNNDGTFSYDPNGQFEHLAVGETATDTFTYTVTDPSGVSSTETVTVTVTGQNDAPVVAALDAIAQEDGPSVTVTASFTDIDSSGPFTFSVDTSGTLGSVTNNGDGTFTYHPNAQFEHLNPGQTAQDTFTYTVTDEAGGSSTETVTITIEGQVEATKLTSSDGSNDDYFGSYIAMNDLGVVVAGAWGDDDHGARSGGAYVYVPNASGGYSQIKLSPADLEESDWFSYNIALNNTGVIAVGSPLDDDTANDAGAVYLFTPDGAGGYTEAKLTLAQGTANGRAGVGLAINDNGMVVAGRTNDAGNAGSIHLFDPDGTGGHTETVLSASDGTFGNSFGYSVSLNNSGVVVAGATNQNGSGAAYVYTPDGSGGYSETKILPSSANDGDKFGHGVAVNNSGTVVVGAYGTDTAANDAGAVFVYEPDGAGGYVETKIIATDAAADDLFGFRVAVNDSGIIVAGTRDDHIDGVRTGAAYVYVPDGDGGYTEFKLSAFDRTGGERFGNSVDVNADGVVTVGATRGDGNEADTGAVYTFVPDENGNYVGPDGTVYTPTGSIGKNEAPVVQPIALTVEEDTPSVEISADFTDANPYDSHSFAIDTSGTLGVVINNGDGTFTYSPSGAFEHLADGETATDTFTYTVDDGRGGTATQTVTITVNGKDNGSNLPPAAKLISSDGIASDYFGSYVAMNDQGMVLAGAWGDDDMGARSGGAYLYTPDGLGGYTETKLVPSGLGTSDWFAYTLDLSDTGIIAICSPLDDDRADDAGAVYVFTPDGIGGFTEAKITLSDGARGDRSGVGLSVNDSGTVVVGRNSNGVYVFEPDGNGGYVETKLTPSDGAAGSLFGYSAFVNNAGVVYAGAFAKGGTGAAYIFTPDGNGGYTETKLVASDATAGDNLGFSGMLNASGTLVVGAFGQDGAGAQAGAIYVYDPNGSGGYTETKIVASDASDADIFGFRVAINDSGVIVAGARDDVNAGGGSGSAYVYVPNEDGGYTEFKLTAFDGLGGDRFGNSVAINADGVVTVGATNGDGNEVNSGAVYTFVPDADGNYVGADGTVYTSSAMAGLKVTGSDAADVISGGTGDDTLAGGNGDDTFVFATGGHDTVTDFTAGAASEDLVQFDTTVFGDFASVLAAAADVGSNTVITIDATSSITLQNVLVAELHQDDFSFI